MQKVFHSAPEIQRRIKVLGRGGQWLCCAELDYMLLSASTNSVYRADILKVFSSAFSQTAPTDLQVHVMLIASLQQTLYLETGHMRKDICTALVYAEILLSWIVQAPAPASVLDRSGPVDVALSHLDTLLTSLSALHVALQDRPSFEKAHFMQFVTEFLTADIRRASSGCVAAVQARHAFAVVCVLRCLWRTATGNPTVETGPLAALLCELVWMASSVRADLGGGRGIPNAKKRCSSRKRKAKRARSPRHASAWLTSKDGGDAGNSSDSDSDRSSSDSDSDASLGEAQGWETQRVSNSPSLPLFIAAREFASALAQPRVKRDTLTRGAITVFGQLSAAVELMLVPDAQRWPVSLLCDVASELGSMAILISKEMPALPQPLWAGSGTRKNAVSAVSQLPAFVDSNEFLRRGRRWHALRRLLALCTLGTEAARRVVAKLVAPVQHCVRALARALPYSYETSSSTFTCGQLLCHLEALTAFSSHHQGGGSEHAALAIQELVTLLEQLFVAVNARCSVAGDAEDRAGDMNAMDFSMLPTAGSADDDEKCCAIRLIAAALGYLVVHRLPLVISRPSVIDMLGPLLGPAASDASRLALLHLSHPAVALYIVAYALPHFGIYTDEVLLLAAAPVAAEAGTDMLRLDLSAAFGNTVQACASQWPPEQEDDCKQTHEGTAPTVRMPNLHLLSSSGLMRLRLALASSFPTALISESGNPRESPERPSVFIFPQGVLYAILEFLSARQLCRAAQASHELRELSLSGKLWYELFRARFSTTLFAGRLGATISELSIAALNGRARVRISERNPLFVPKPQKKDVPATAANTSAPPLPIAAGAYVFNRNGVCLNCYGPSGITGSGSSIVAAATAMLARIPQLPLPIRRKQTIACCSDHVRHDWRSLFMSRWLALQAAKKKNRVSDSVRVSVCPVVGCCYLYKDVGAYEKHMLHIHPFIRRPPKSEKRR